MAQDKNSIIFYRDWKDIFDSLNDTDCAELVRHIFRYVNDENPKTDNPLVNAHFLHIRNCLKRDLRKWDETREKRSNSGKAGAKARWQAMANDGKRINDVAKIAVSVSDNVNVNDNVSENNTHTLGSTNENYILILPKQIGLEKYRINGPDGLLELFSSIGSVLPLYTPDMGRIFMRNNKGKIFNEVQHVWNTWNQFTKNQ